MAVIRGGVCFHNPFSVPNVLRKGRKGKFILWRLADISAHGSGTPQSSFYSRERTRGQSARKNPIPGPRLDGARYTPLCSAL